MTAALDRYTAALGHPNVRAFLRVIRAGESTQTDEAYRLTYGGALFEAPPWRHPFYGIPTTQGAKASGAYQFLGTTWQRCDEALGLGGDFSPASQDVAAVYLIDQRNALGDVLAGNIAAACHKLALEWVSLPHLGAAKATKVFLDYGGAAQIAPGAPIAPAPVSTPTTQEKKPMPALALLQLFAPMLTQLIPQIAAIFKPGSEVAQRNVNLAQVILDTITTAAGTPNLQGAIEAMQADKAVQRKVQEAIVTTPEVIETLGLVEIGGGVKAAREAFTPQEGRPWWTFLANGAFWVTVFLSPALYLVIYKVMWDSESSEQLKTVVVTAVLSGLLGAMTGFWYGAAYSSTRTTRPTSPTAPNQ